MSEPFRRDDHQDRIGRTMDEQRMRALRRLDGQAVAAVGKNFSSACPEGTGDFVAALASVIAWDLTALGLTVSAGTRSELPGGVWLAPAPDQPAVIVSWTQHDASAAAFGHRMHRDLQRHMNLILFEILHMLGYAVDRYGPGDAHIVSRFRAPLDGYHGPASPTG